jgi:hypothetical protein
MAQWHGAAETGPPHKGDGMRRIRMQKSGAA